tara:strand:- start:103 stop:378 length:276 start_codon:yes stop_codon:yes gene_type:complete
MHHFFTIWIRLYWLIFRERDRRICLYKETCSKYIYRKFIEESIFSGFKAFLERFRNCRSTYNIVRKEGEVMIITKCGREIESSDINPYILE